jgi:sigma-E factor negative regulatory protein RseA
MTQETMNDHEVISALADGQLRGDEFVRAVNLLELSSEHRSTWHAYHAVGDMMRTGACQTIERDSAFLQRLRLSLTQEPQPSQGVTVAVAVLKEGSVETIANSGPAGNDALFRWKAWGGLFSVIAVSFVAWQLFTGAETPRGLAQVDPSTVPIPAIGKNEPSSLSVTEGQAVMIRDPRLGALLAAHQQLGGTSAFQNPTGFVRSATFSEADR